MRKKIRCWKVAQSNVSLKDALNMFNHRAINGVLYNDIGLRFGNRIFQYGIDDIKSAAFSIDEVLKNTWEVLIPDDGAEEMTENCRKVIKESHYTGEHFQKIDNMTITDMFKSVFDKLNLTSDVVKYRIIKKIIEDKLYMEEDEEAIGFYRKE